MSERRDTAIMYMERGEWCWRERDYDEARQSFFRGVEAWKQAAAQDASLTPQWHAAQERFAEYMKDDEMLKRLLPECKAVIAKHPGLLQTDLYAMIKEDEYVDDDVRMVLYFAEKQGEIMRTKKGRTYELRLPASKVRGEGVSFLRRVFRYLWAPCLLAILSCSHSPRVGDWYEVVKTRERVKIEMIGTLDQVKAYADTFYTRKARKNMESFRGTSVLDFMGVAEVKEQFGAELQLDEARYRDYQDRKDHAFFLHYEGEHNEGVMFGPVEMLEKDYRRVE